MATVKQTRTHDMLQLRVSYAKGSSLLITCSRNGERIKLDPEDFDTSLKIAALIAHVKRAMAVPGAKVKDYGVMFDLLEEAAKRAASIPHFADEARSALSMPDGLPKPRHDRTAPATTRARHTAGRSHKVSIDFASGEHTEISIGKSSAGTLSDPAVSTLDDRIMSFVLSSKPMGYEPETTAKALAAHAESSPDLTTFVRTLGPAIFRAALP